MIRNYLSSAWRSLAKNRFFSLINILGISIGMAASLLILEYVNFELSYDRFNKNGSDIYRVYNDRYQNGKILVHSTMTYSGVSKAMFADFPEIEAYTRVSQGGPSIILSGDNKIAGQRILAVETTFLSIFSYPLIAGDPHISLSTPRSVVLTESLVKKLFGIGENNAASILGKIISIGKNTNLFTITGICKDIPENSHLQFDLLVSYVTNSLVYSSKDAWSQADNDFTNPHFWHYIQLKPGTNYKTVEAKFADFSQRHFQESKISGIIEKFYLQPLLRAHMYSAFEFEIGITTSATFVWGLFVIAMLILIIAWSNHINLATAKSMERAKEVGIRKVAGATKNQLIAQFMTESLIINLFSLVTAVIIVGLVQRSFNTIVNHPLSLRYLLKESIGGYSFSVLLLLSILSGIFLSGFYPSFVLSSFKPILVLKGKFVNSLMGITMRKLLVIGQFTITAILIISSIGVYQQLRYVSEQDLGFNMSQILVINSPQLADWDSVLLLKQNSFVLETEKIPGVLAAAFSWSLLGEELPQNSDIRRLDQPVSSNLAVRRNGISPGFINLYQMKLLAGREFLNSDFNALGIGLHNLILNSTAIKMLEFPSPESAIGRPISLLGGEYNIVGVVADFHQKSLHYAIEPTLFYPSSASPLSPFSVRVDPHHLKATIGAIRQKYDAIFPGNLFNYYFLDEKFNQQYNSDQVFGKVFAIFSVLTIFIACLGLFGLSLFATAQRTKEIGTRKVLGGSIGGIVIMLSKEFIWLVLLAILIASPIAWYIMHYWLENFAYRTNLSWWIFVGSGLLMLMIAFITISFQSIKAASVSPAKCLRSE